jgi:uncharacterized cupin superfamily protein
MRRRAEPTRYGPEMVEKVLRRAAQLYARSLHGLGSRLTSAVLPRAGEPLEPAPIPAEWIEAGAPSASSRFLAASGDGGLAAGVWECSAGTFQWHFECDEVVYVLEGGVVVEHEGQRHVLERGSLAFFPLGARTRWEVATHVRKLFVHRHPTPYVRKLVGLSH